jgi:predicted transcriptional regulator
LGLPLLLGPKVRKRNKAKEIETICEIASQVPPVEKDNRSDITSSIFPNQSLGALKNKGTTLHL